jgi:hypothetical protein
MGFRGRQVVLGGDHDPRDTVMCGGEYFGDCTVVGVLIRRVVVGLGAALVGAAGAGGLRASGGVSPWALCAGTEFVTRGADVTGGGSGTGGGGGGSMGVGIATGTSTTGVGTAPVSAAVWTATSLAGSASGFRVSA